MELSCKYFIQWCYSRNLGPWKTWGAGALLVPHLCRTYKPKSVESVFRYTCCITLPEASIECAGPISASLCRTTHLHSKKCHCCGEPLAALCVWFSPALDLNLRPPAPKTNVIGRGEEKICWGAQISFTLIFGRGIKKGFHPGRLPFFGAQVLLEGSRSLPGRARRNPMERI